MRYIIYGFIGVVIAALLAVFVLDFNKVTDTLGLLLFGSFLGYAFAEYTDH